jgi:hypothetical protein
MTRDKADQCTYKKKIKQISVLFSMMGKVDQYNMMSFKWLIACKMNGMQSFQSAELFYYCLVRDISSLISC